MSRGNFRNEILPGSPEMKMTLMWRGLNSPEQAGRQLYFRYTVNCVTKVNANAKKGTAAGVPLFQEIYRTLLDDIFRGELRSGTVVAEEGLAAQFGVSRTPIREALIRLINDGFLEKGASRSYIVTDISLESVRNVFDLRFLLEPAAAIKAAGNPFRMDPVSRARKIVDEMRQWQGEERNPERLLKFNRLDIRFHEVIAEASGNRLMAKYVSELMKHSGHFWMLVNPQAKGITLTSTVQEHSRILDAIREGKAAEAGASLEKHLLNARERLKV